MKEDENIERFFKKRLESSEFDYQDKDWQDLEEKLDAAGLTPPASGALISRVKLLIAGLIISSVAFLLGWFSHDRIMEASGSGQPVPGAGQSIHGNMSLPGPEPAPQLPDEPAANADVLTGSAAELKDSEAVSENLWLTAHPAAPSAEESQGQQLETKVRQPMRKLDGISGKIVTENPAHHRSLLLTEEKPEEEGQAVTSFRNRWYVGLSLAPDLNSIGLTERKSVSPKLGMQVFYRVADRWSVSTGVLYNKKRYNTTAESYSPPDGYWYAGTNGVKPSAILGSCAVLDVPVKVYYRWSQGRKFGFYISIGVSNYFLLDEAYDFEFDQPNPGSADGWYTNENSSVIAGVANVSVLAGVQLSPRAELLVEPYLKAPLTKIGWGKVDLFSTGLLFTFRYRLFSSRKGNRDY